MVLEAGLRDGKGNYDSLIFFLNSLLSFDFSVNLIQINSINKLEKSVVPD
jgi:ABC-type antimicrobial peptide transport system permease subunit